MYEIVNILFLIQHFDQCCLISCGKDKGACACQLKTFGGVWGNLALTIPQRQTKGYDVVRFGGGALCTYWCLISSQICKAGRVVENS